MNASPRQTIFLIRHTAPAVERGICYGQSDVGLKESFLEEAETIKPFLPEISCQIFSSPLLRCRKLAQQLFPSDPVYLEPALMEIHCGDWELKNWDHIPKGEMDPWMKDFVRIRMPGGESYVDLFSRVTQFFNSITYSGRDAIIFTHGGVIRSILSYITQTSLTDSFSIFSLHYSCVVKLTGFGKAFRHEILSNPPQSKEKHRPEA